MSDIVPYTTDDPRYFTVTSAQDYDRHHYKVIFKDGTTKVCQSWEEANSIWFQWARMRLIETIEVLDIPKSKSKPKPKVLMTEATRPQRYMSLYKSRDFRGKYLYTAMNQLWLIMTDEERAEVNKNFNYADNFILFRNNYTVDQDKLNGVVDAISKDDRCDDGLPHIILH